MLWQFAIAARSPRDMISKSCAWDRLRRNVRDPYLDKTGLALVGLFGGLLLFRLRSDGGDLDAVDLGELLSATVYFVGFFLVWFPSYVLIILFAPRIMLDYENKEKYVDQSLKTHDSSTHDEFRMQYIDGWDDKVLCYFPLRMAICAMQMVSYLLYFLSLFRAGLAVYPLALLPT